MTLEPGDVVLTGTPAGVGLGQKPEPVFLKPGDVMRLGADGLGEQRLWSARPCGSRPASAGYGPLSPGRSKALAITKHG